MVVMLKIVVVGLYRNVISAAEKSYLHIVLERNIRTISKYEVHIM